MTTNDQQLIYRDGYMYAAGSPYDTAATRGDDEPSVQRAVNLANCKTTWKWIDPLFRSGHPLYLLDFRRLPQADREAARNFDGFTQTNAYMHFRSVLKDEGAGWLIALDTEHNSTLRSMLEITLHEISHLIVYACEGIKPGFSEGIPRTPAQSHNGPFLRTALHVHYRATRLVDSASLPSLDRMVGSVATRDPAGYWVALRDELASVPTDAPLVDALRVPPPPAFRGLWESEHGKMYWHIYGPSSATPSSATPTPPATPSPPARSSSSERPRDSVARFAPWLTQASWWGRQRAS